MSRRGEPRQGGCGRVRPSARSGGRISHHGRAGRIGRDLKNLRNIDVYVVAACSLACSLLSLCGDLLSDGIRWGILSSGIALLVGRTALPGDEEAFDGPIGDRSAFDAQSLPAALRKAREVWLLAPSGKNFLTSTNCDLLRRHVLARRDGSVRVVVIDGSDECAVSLTTRQLTESTEFPVQPFPDSLATALHQLRTMAAWPVAGSIEYRTFGYNPGFSILALDPADQDGVIVVEFHGVRNESTSSRMHLRFTRQEYGHWFGYWCRQFTHVWSTAQASGSPITGR